MHCAGCSPYPVPEIWPVEIYKLVGAEWQKQIVDEWWEQHRSNLLSVSQSDTEYMDERVLFERCWMCKHKKCSELCLTVNFDTYYKFPNGKHKGKSIRSGDVDSQYLRWYAKTHSELRNAIRRVLRAEIPKKR